jgi:hypothetical protein
MMRDQRVSTIASPGRSRTVAGFVRAVLAEHLHDARHDVIGEDARSNGRELRALVECSSSFAPGAIVTVCSVND